MNQRTLRRLLVGSAMCVAILMLGCGCKRASPPRADPSAQMAAVLASGLESVDVGAITSALPKGWRIAEPEAVPAPTGLAGDGKDGIRIVFTGPRYVKRPKRMKVAAGKESFTLCIMPADYAPRLPKMPTQACAQFLGSSAEHKVFYTVKTASVPTWPKWKADLAVVLLLDREEP